MAQTRPSGYRSEHRIHERSLRLSTDEFHGVVDHDLRHALNVILRGEIRKFADLDDVRGDIAILDR